MQELYDELKGMGVNVAALREADLTEKELVELANALKRLLKDRKTNTSKNLIDVA